MPGWLRNRQQPTLKLLRFIAVFFLINTVVFWLVGSPYLGSILHSETLTKNFIADYSTTAGTTLILIYSVVNYLCYLMFLAAIPAVFSAIMAIFLPYKRFILPVTILVETIALIVLMLDLSIYLMFKFHLNITLINMLLSNDWQDMLDPSRRELIQLYLIGAGIPIFEIICAIIIWRITPTKQCTRLLITIFSFLACGCLLCYLTLMLSITNNNILFIQQAPNLPLYTQLISLITPLSNAETTLQALSEHHYAQAVFANTPLHYPKHPMQCQIPSTKTNIIIIMVDALRADSLPHMPQLSKFAKKSWSFAQHISGGNSTQAGIFSFFYSIPSNYWTAALQQKRAPIFMELLRKYGYTTHALWSASMQAPPMHRTVFRQFDTISLHGSTGQDTAARDQATTQNAQDFLAKHAQQNTPFFLHILYDAPHAFCSTQRFAKPHLPDIPNCSRLPFINMNRTALFNNYLNAVHFSDHEIGKLLETIDRLDLLKNSIVIISSDHGQEFDDTHHDYWGHCSNYSSFQTHVPLIIHWPEQSAKIITHQTSGYDLMPTLFDRLFHCKNSHADYSIGYDIMQKSGRMPFVLAGSYVTMGLIEPDRITTLHASGTIEITGPNGDLMQNTVSRPSTYKVALQLMRKYFN